MIAYPPVHLDLARRLEHAEGAANASFVDARARVDPSIGAMWIEVAGVHAMFDGVNSPCTQTFGLGLFDPFLEREFDMVEDFFFSRGASTHHEVSALAADATVRLLHARDYAPIEASMALVRPLSDNDHATQSHIIVRHIGDAERDQWAHVAGQGWGSESAELGAFVEGLSRVTAQARGMHCFLAEADGQPIAAAALNLSAGIALLAGATTIPLARRRGAQQALLNARLSFAAERGIDLAMIVTQPGSASQRNAERQGFRPVYSRTKWERRFSAVPHSVAPVAP